MTPNTPEFSNGEVGFGEIYYDWRLGQVDDNRRI